MELFAKYQQGLPYAEFIARYANAAQKDRWHAVHGLVTLDAEQKKLLGSFRRRMPVLCLAGAWCGDCINQCPIFEHFTRACPLIDVRYLDRDEHADVQQALQINAGNRVPVVVFFSEDGKEVARYGERTLSKYRSMMAQMEGESCPTGIQVAGDTLLPQVTRDWLDEFERVQWILRLSPRLRSLYGD